MSARKSSDMTLDEARAFASDPEVYRDVWGGRWVGVTLERVEADALRALIVDAWRLAAPRALARAHRSTLGA